MLNRRYVATTFIVVATLFIFGIAMAAEEVTLATVPTIVPISIDGNTHTFQIQTTNAPNTEMKIEKSNTSTFTEKVILHEWQLFSNNQTFSDTLAENTKAYYRIKARNLNNIETEYSEPLLVYSMPTRPQLSNIDRQTENITLTFDNPAEGIVFWIKREGLEPIQSTGTFKDTVLPASKYTYTFWADNNGVLSAENTITVWSLPLVKSSDITITSNQTSIVVIVNSPNSTIELEIKKAGEWISIPTPYIINNLTPNTEYEFRVRSKSYNDEYSEWHYFTKRTESAPATSGGGASPDIAKLQRQQEFQKQADMYFNSITYSADGDINSSSAWIELSIPKSQLDMKITIDNKTMQKQDKVKFTNLKDNSDYTAKVIISNNEFEYAKDISISTPNRTPPEILGLYYDTDTGELIVKVKANTEIK